MSLQAGLWTLSGASAALALFAGWRDHRRTRRRDLDRPGWAPWDTLQILSAIAAVAAAAAALHV